MAVGALECLARCRPIGELIAVRMLVALGATKIGKVKSTFGGNRLIRLRLVTRLARDRDVRAHQLEAALLMSAERKRGWAEPVNVVALLALPFARTLGKLPFMGVGVAIHAGSERDFIERLLALRLVAPLALHVGMLADQRVVRRRVIVQRERRRRKAFLVVARGAIAAGFSIVELAPMDVFMALRAFGVLDRLLEICARMALGAAQSNVLAHKREIRLRVIEMGRSAHNVPPGIDVATRTGLSECAAMRIFVASLAFSKTDAGVLHMPICFCVALGALQVRMPPGERKLCRLMIELRDGREVIEAMATFALHPELTLVLVLVTRGAGRPQAQKGPRSVLDFYLA